jgi:flagellar biosynthesis protein FliQ
MAAQCDDMIQVILWTLMLCFAGLVVAITATVIWALIMAIRAIKEQG